MLFWIGWFARFHLDPEGVRYVPYEIKTIDSPVVRADGIPALRGDGQTMTVRCVREIAVRRFDGGEEWLMFSWNIGLPGVTIQKCSSAEAALAAFHAPPEKIRLS